MELNIKGKDEGDIKVSEEVYIPICSNCKSEIKNINLTISHYCNSDNDISINKDEKGREYSFQSFKIGISSLIYFIALISTNLGFMNLLPIPVLDGGYLFFFSIEIIFRKKIPEKIQTMLLNCGFYLLLLIMFFSTFNDLKSLF